jgi:hypothetical protein
MVFLMEFGLMEFLKMEYLEANGKAELEAINN